MFNLNFLQTQFQIGPFEFSLMPGYCSLDLRILAMILNFYKNAYPYQSRHFDLEQHFAQRFFLTASFKFFKDSISWRSTVSPALLFPVPLCEETFDL